jgi:hypothetical protein
MDHMIRPQSPPRRLCTLRRRLPAVLRQQGATSRNA